MAGRKFNEWLNTFRASINSYKYYTDFEKVFANVEKLKKEICILYSLIGSKDIEKDFKELVTEYPKCLKAIPILLAVREKEIYCQDENGCFNYCFDKKNQTIEQYIYFMRQTGLFNMLQHPNRASLYDYVTGVETGLDSNGRKNRGGHQMENLVESFIKNTDNEYYKEMCLSEIERKWNIDLSAISDNGTTERRWDFVVKTDSCIYAIEANFYTSNGSKLNEVARSYKMIAEEAKNIKKFKFIWLTDGRGWFNAKNNLEETFNVLEDLYNIADMERGVLKKILK